MHWKADDFDEVCFYSLGEAEKQAMRGNSCQHAIIGASDQHCIQSFPLDVAIHPFMLGVYLDLTSCTHSVFVTGRHCEGFTNRIEGGIC